MHFSLSDELDGVKDPYSVKSSGAFKNTDCYSALEVTLTYSFHRNAELVTKITKWQTNWTWTAYPQHIAIIMDGNGRWAAEQGKPRSYGHQAGVDTVRAYHPNVPVWV